MQSDWFIFLAKKFARNVLSVQIEREKKKANLSSSLHRCIGAKTTILQKLVSKRVNALLLPSEILRG